MLVNTGPEDAAEPENAGPDWSIRDHQLISYSLKVLPNDLTLTKGIGAGKIAPLRSKVKE